MPPTRRHLPRDFVTASPYTRRGKGNDADTALRLGLRPHPVRACLITSIVGYDPGTLQIRGKSAFVHDAV